MAVYEVHLKGPDDAVRVTQLEAKSKEAAKLVCEEKERDLVAFRLEEPDEADLPHQLAHEQTKPYEVVSVKEVK